MKGLLKHGGIIAITLALAASVAFAAAAVDFRSAIQWNQAGTWTLPKSASGAQPTTTNLVTRMLAGSETFDFTSSTITCQDSTGVTVTGAQVGDGCDVGTPATAWGNAHFDCYVSAANTVKIHFCPAGTAVDPASGTYRSYIRSNQ